MGLLEIKDLHASVILDGVNKKKKILNGVNLTIDNNTINVLMGPNGSGKSTLGYVIAGHPKYHIDSGSILFNGNDILSMSVSERAIAGIFLGMQYPTAVQGVSVLNFLKTAVSSRSKETINLVRFIKKVKENMKVLGMSDDFVTRNVNEGFSGGEKKRFEMLQMSIINPKIGILDEIDSGLDIDGLRSIFKGINDLWLNNKNDDRGIILVTHYTNILKYINVNKIYIFAQGKIVKEGDISLIKEIEVNGYNQYL